VPLGLTPLQVLRFMDTAKPVQYRVTVPEGWTMEQIAAVFARDHWVDPENFLQLCRDKIFIQHLGISADSLEGYLFPETYTLVRGEVDEKSLITTMVHRFLTIWDGLDKPGDIKLNRHQLVTLASIVEKETGYSGERAVITGVFYNRLKKGMRLQSDPTTIYGLKDFNGNLTRADLKKETPYNTYVITGLPPGPICNPGRAALKAVLQPAKVPYYYFVSKNDGSHSFSTTLKEHNRAVYKYQKSRQRGKSQRE
ncbi:MAG: endolytic transglycosylase MltG, partial [Desulfobulbaceae bacterium]|nr:endolytic transglycosylase MltG [Desulfobulbaceae bacterium]